MSRLLSCLRASEWGRAWASSALAGSSVATPVLALLGAPGLIAVASPLPATIPAAGVGAVPYLRASEARLRAAAWSILGGFPGTIAGALLSRVVCGASLLVASGVVLILVGLRVLWPIEDAAREVGTRRRQNRPLLVAATAGVGVFTGLLANGGGFLLVPTLVTHWALGHIDWPLAGEFALGLLPGSVTGSRLAHRVQGPTLRRAFGLFLVVFGLFFTAYRIAQS